MKSVIGNTAWKADLDARLRAVHIIHVQRSLLGFGSPAADMLGNACDHVTGIWPNTPSTDCIRMHCARTVAWMRALHVSPADLGRLF
jgi:hypothetical protein